MAITVDHGHSAARQDTARRGLRERAFRSADRHTRLVRFLRVALPLGAFFCLLYYAVTFGVSWRLGRGQLRLGEIEITADDLTMKNPSYFGQAKDGGRYEVRARKAVLELNPQAPIKLIDIDGELIGANAVVTRLKARHGLFDNAKNELELFDGISIEGTNGLRARLSRAMIYSKENRIVSKEPVDVAMPAGHVKGAAMTLRTDTHEATFVGNVAVELAGSTQPPRTPAPGGAARPPEQPIEVISDNLYVNDTTKVAVFMGGVIATQGDSTLKSPELHIAYEGKAGDQLLSSDQPADSSRLSRLVATGGAVVTIGTDRRITSDQAAFDAKSDTALFTGNVLVNQSRNVLQGQRLAVDRKTGKSRLDAPAEGGQPAGRIAATLYQNETRAAAPAHKGKSGAADAVGAWQGQAFGSFKTDPNAPIDVEADTLDINDALKQATFHGNVKSQQGDVIVRTVEMIAFWTGQGGLAAINGGEDGTRQPAQLARVEAREQVLIKSKDGQSATGDWATFDIKANTVLLGDHVVVSRGKDVAQGPRLKIDLTTGMYRFEVETEAAPGPATSASAPQTAPPPAPAADPSQRACPPGKQCVLFYPKDAHERAKEGANKALPGGHPEKAHEGPRDGWEPSNSSSPVMRGN